MMEQSFDFQDKVELLKKSYLSYREKQPVLLPAKFAPEKSNKETSYNINEQIKLCHNKK